MDQPQYLSVCLSSSGLCLCPSR